MYKRQVFHAAEYDLILLRRDYDWHLHNLFDTMWAARILGYKQFGLAGMLEGAFGLRLSKRFQKANWCHRPLSAGELAYAQKDTHYLLSRDPFQLADMDRAADRVVRALRTGETIAIYGDFDADGVTATVLLTEALRAMADERRLVVPYIPNRVDEGYGLNQEALTTLRGKGVDLVISVDCGIRSPIEVAHAQSIGLDMIVTDHHSLGRELPPAVAVINPKRDDSGYPERMLAGVGIAFKLAQALRLAWPERANWDESNLLDLVSIDVYKRQEQVRLAQRRGDRFVVPRRGCPRRRTPRRQPAPHLVAQGSRFGDAGLLQDTDQRHGRVTHGE